MIDSVKKAIEEIEKLSEKKQQEMAQLIHEEISWDSTLLQNQDQLSQIGMTMLGQ